MQPGCGNMGNGVCTVMHARSTWMLLPPAVQNRAASFRSHAPVQKLYAVPTSALPASCTSIMSSRYVVQASQVLPKFCSPLLSARFDRLEATPPAQRPRPQSTSSGSPLPRLPETEPAWDATSRCRWCLRCRSAAPAPPGLCPQTGWTRLQPRTCLLKRQSLCSQKLDPDCCARLTRMTGSNSNVAKKPTFVEDCSEVVWVGRAGGNAPYFRRMCVGACHFEHVAITIQLQQLHLHRPDCMLTAR